MSNYKISIIILAYSYLKKTRVCMENISKYTNLCYKLILWDSDTSDNSISDYFEYIKYPIIKFF